MLFNIEKDEGHRIHAYVVPDGYSGIPTVRIYSGETLVLRCSANESRQALVDAGRHETGLCGFNIGPEMAPSLIDLPDLLIVEDDTNLLIYRRPKRDRIHRKILRLETHLFPLARFDECFHNHMQYVQTGLDQFGRETVTQIFQLNEIDSIYVSGRLLYKNFAYWIENGFDMALMIHHPYDELAERLLVLSFLRENAEKILGARDALHFAPALKFAAGLSFENDRALKRSLLDMPSNVAGLLTDPLVRQLTAASPQDMASSASVPAALDVLASCGVVGLRHDPDYFQQAMATWLTINSKKLSLPPAFPRVASLALFLQESRTVDHLLERDLEVYETVRNAMGGWDKNRRCAK